MSNTCRGQEIFQFLKKCEGIFIRHCVTVYKMVNNRGAGIVDMKESPCKEHYFDKLGK